MWHCVHKVVGYSPMSNKPGRRSWLERWRAWWRRPPPHAGDDVARARALLAAIDAGGVPLNPARVNAIARGLGLEVSAHAPVERTIERIRAAMGRLPQA